MKKNPSEKPIPNSYRKFFSFMELKSQFCKSFMDQKTMLIKEHAWLYADFVKIPLFWNLVNLNCETIHVFVFRKPVVTFDSFTANCRNKVVYKEISMRGLKMIHEHVSKLPNAQIIVIDFDDFCCGNSENVTKNLCSLLEIEYHPNMNNWQNHDKNLNSAESEHKSVLATTNFSTRFHTSKFHSDTKLPKEIEDNYEIYNYFLKRKNHIRD